MIGEIELEKLAGSNINQPIIEVDEFEGRQDCPECIVGSLVGTRNPETLEFLMTDRCLLCGQQVHYKKSSYAT